VCLKFIHQQDRFLTLPFQAFECCLFGVDPANASEPWSQEAREAFCDLTFGKPLLATFREVDDVMATIQLAPMDEPHLDVAECLIKAGLASRRISCATKSTSKSLPG
jgi:hypothetical protein